MAKYNSTVPTILQLHHLFVAIIFVWKFVFKIVYKIIFKIVRVKCKVNEYKHIVHGKMVFINFE